MARGAECTQRLGVYVCTAVVSHGERGAVGVEVRVGRKEVTYALVQRRLLLQRAVDFRGLVRLGGPRPAARQQQGLHRQPKTHTVATQRSEDPPLRVCSSLHLSAAALRLWAQRVKLLAKGPLQGGARVAAHRQLLLVAAVAVGHARVGALEQRGHLEARALARLLWVRHTRLALLGPLLRPARPPTAPAQRTCSGACPTRANPEREKVLLLLPTTAWVYGMMVRHTCARNNCAWRSTRLLAPTPSISLFFFGITPLSVSHPSCSGLSARLLPAADCEPSMTLSLVTSSDLCRFAHSHDGYSATAVGREVVRTHPFTTLNSTARGFVRSPRRMAGGLSKGRVRASRNEASAAHGRIAWPSRVCCARSKRRYTRVLFKP